MNNGYKIRKGGFGTVKAIVMLHAILIAHATISRENLNGYALKSSVIHFRVYVKKSAINLLS
jgi:hypothetical protein